MNVEKILKLASEFEKSAQDAIYNKKFAVRYDPQTLRALSETPMTKSQAIQTAANLNKASGLSGIIFWATDL